MDIIKKTHLKDHKPGDLIYIDDFKQPFKFIKIEENGLIKVRHTVSQASFSLSPYYSCTDKEFPTTETIDGKVCIDGGWLIRSEILTSSNFKTLVNRKRMNRMRRGGNGRTSMIELESIPTKYRLKIFELLSINPSILSHV